MEKIYKPPIVDAKHIPIIINNRNRLTYLKQLIAFLENHDYKNIYIIDNASTFPDLLNYYTECPYKVFRLNKNMGYLALWKTTIYKQFIKNYYVYTDPDILPIEDCPDDFLEVFRKAMLLDKDLYKVGFSLKIDDLPDTYAYKNEVIAWESQFHNERVSPLFYKADIDTTFALYRPWFKGGSNQNMKMYRSAAPYSARHLPWYIDLNNMSLEDRFYKNNSTTITYWTNKQ